MSSLPIKRALISVYDKTNLDKLAAFLISQDVLLISTGGTARFLHEHGINFTDVASVTNFPEILDGRIKTLNPRIHAGILFDREKMDHCQTLNLLDILPIDLVVSNLYPFAAAAQPADASDQELLENIDIGGPTMLRAAAKNHPHVCVLSSADSYDDFMRHYEQNQATTAAFRSKQAALAFSHTASYDATIADVFRDRYLAPKTLLRYGENPHQQAHLVVKHTGPGVLNLAGTKPLCGQALSYNNMLDAQAAILALRSLSVHRPHDRPASIVVKHGIPCGAARANSSPQAISMAISSDEESAFGGILSCSHTFDLACAKTVEHRFFEIIIAPTFSQDAQAFLSHKKNLRLIAIDNLMSGTLEARSHRSILGGVLEQNTDILGVNPALWQCVTQIKPSPSDLEAMQTAFRLVIPTPSNAITLATADHLLGVGAGQPKRIQSCQIAIDSARARGFDLSLAAMGSDAFFPFPDGLDYAHAHGLRLVIQPGGSIKDRDVIKRADELNMCMVFTGMRHFKH